MAISSAKSALFCYMIVVLYFLLIVSTVESSRSFRVTGTEGETPECDAVYAAVEGDSCFSVTKLFGLTTEFFNSINPNLNCDKIFVGQWLCVDGSA